MSSRVLRVQPSAWAGRTHPSGVVPGSDTVASWVERRRAFLVSGSSHRSSSVLPETFVKRHTTQSYGFSPIRPSSAARWESREAARIKSSSRKRSNKAADVGGFV